MLQTLRAEDISLIESAPKRWKALECPNAEDRITGEMSCIAMTGFIVLLLSLNNNQLIINSKLFLVSYKEKH